ncbi:hypothetical protein NLJ89_g5115 [Agrocybe chaxingu]|uniref:Uncharacterized protein n=1 Tax=Agrocybe chaxingu TaxID=84603 RepID=A0A9W8K2V9_9AGAR|nr:hypothetical protein NLJ89_g5115 [Agrocybe chaxingu]
MSKKKTLAGAAGKPPKRRGAQPTRFPLEQHHINLIDSYMPQFRQKVYALDPQLNGNCAELTKWKKATAEEILDDPTFADIRAQIPSAMGSSRTTSEALDDIDTDGEKPKIETYTAWVAVCAGH